MKKIITVILFSIISTFAFAEHTLNVSLLSSIGATARDIGEEKYTGSPVSIGLSTEYLYVFNQGFSLGGNISLFFYEANSLSPVDSIINVSDNVYGTGFSLAPALGWTYKGDIFLFQFVDYPIILHSAKYTKNTVTIGNRTSPEYDIDASLATIKTGAGVFFEWGWKDFRLGFGTGLNIHLLDDYNDKMESVSGLDFVGTSKFTFLF